MLLINTDTVITHRKNPFFFFSFGLYIDLLGHIFFTKFNRVCDKVLEEFYQLYLIRHYRRQNSVTYLCAALTDSDLKICFGII